MTTRATRFRSDRRTAPTCRASAGTSSRRRRSSLRCDRHRAATWRSADRRRVRSPQSGCARHRARRRPVQPRLNGPRWRTRRAAPTPCPAPARTATAWPACSRSRRHPGSCRCGPADAPPAAPARWFARPRRSSPAGTGTGGRRSCGTATADGWSRSAAAPGSPTARRRRCWRCPPAPRGRASAEVRRGTGSSH